MTQVPILEHMAAVGDAVRCRLLVLLERRELTVSELCAVLQLPQSTISRHLKTLADDEWVASRRDGTSRFYVMNPDDLADEARGLWTVVRSQFAGSPTARQDQNRLKGILGRRRTRSRKFFSSAAGQWDKLRADLFGEDFHLSALLGLMDSSWVVGDLGCGTGQMTATLAPFVREVIGVDGSAEMLEAARSRLRGLDNVTLRQGELDSLPIEDESLDAAVLMLVLHYVPEPARALAEAARVIRPDGRLLVVDMMPHDREEYQHRMGHVWLGFSEKQITQYLNAGGFGGLTVKPLPPSSTAKGPDLFAAVARRGTRPNLMRARESSPARREATTQRSERSR